MPLSEHEQRLLEQMERALYAEDPKFATSMKGAELRSRYRRRAVAAGFGFIVGIGLLMAGPVSGGSTGLTAALGAAGFALMLTSAAFAVTSWRKMPAVDDTAPVAPNRSKVSRKPAKESFMTRVENRWRQRRDGMGR